MAGANLTIVTSTGLVVQDVCKPPTAFEIHMFLQESFHDLSLVLFHWPYAPLQKQMGNTEKGIAV